MRHKRTSKLISLILTVCLIVTMMPAMAFASEVQADGNAAESSAEQIISTENKSTDFSFAPEIEATHEESTDFENEKVKDISQVTEDDIVLEDSGEAVTTYDLGRNHRAKVFYSYDVRYEDEDGKLLDYDSELVEIKEGEVTEQGESLDGYKYTNRQGKYKHFIPEDISEATPLLMENGKYSISMAPIGNLRAILNQSKVKGNLKKELTETVSGKKQKNVKVTYGSPAGGTYVEYTSLNDSIKEEIVLTEKPKKNEFTFKLKLKGLSYRMNPTDNGITFYDDETGEIVAGIDAPFMNDATGNAYSDAIIYTMERRGNSDNYVLTMTIDEDYLNDAEREYPVIIDPTATWVGSSQIHDAYIISGYPTSNFYSTSTKIMVSGLGSQGKNRTPMKLLNLKAGLEDCDISSAYLDIYENGNGLSGKVVRIYKILESWSESSVTWNTCPDWGTATSYLAAATSTGSNGNRLRFYVTDWVQSVADGGSNYGLMLKNQVEASTSYCEFYGSRSTSTSYRPKLTVTYEVDTPTTATSVTASKSTYNVGESISVSWSGITAKSLDHIEYRVAKCDSSGNITNDEYVPYTRLTSAKSSGTATIPGSSSFPEGYYAIYIRGVSATGHNGTGKHCDVRVSKDKPTMATDVWVDSTFNLKENVLIYWEGITAENLKHYEYRVAECDDDGNITDSQFVPYTAFSTTYGTTKKSAYIPGSYNWSAGWYKVYVRGVSSNGTNGTGKHCDVFKVDEPAMIGDLYFKNAGGTVIPDGQYVGVQNITAIGASITNDEPVVGSDFLYFLYDPNGSHTATGYEASVSASSDGIYTAANTLSSSLFTQSGAYTYYLFIFDEIDGTSEIDFLKKNIYIDNTAPSYNVKPKIIDFSDFFKLFYLIKQS